MKNLLLQLINNTNEEQFTLEKFFQATIERGIWTDEQAIRDALAAEQENNEKLQERIKELNKKINSLEEENAKLENYLEGCEERFSEK
jgi:DNA-binding transcriptional regulator GbsR (MarR family)